MEKIAIIGMGCLFPDYSDKKKFFNTLMTGGRLLNQENFHGKLVDRGAIPFSGRSFFDDKFPADQLAELDALGELYKWVAYVTDEALKDAGYANDYACLKRTGMVMGTLSQITREQFDMMQPYLDTVMTRNIRTVLDDDQFKYHYQRQNEKQTLDCLMADTEPVRYTARKRQMGGPLVSFNAACATPLYAIRLASYYLSIGEADMIFAGSHCANELIQVSFGLFDTFGVLCEAGQSNPLDKNTKGLITSSGAGGFLLKRLTDAENDGDKILAVIESIGWSNDGGTSAGIMSPSVVGQLEAYESAYLSGVSQEIDYIECHATGTEIGDAVEIESISRFFSDKVPLFGALKGTTGHFFTASTCAAIAKVLLAMENGVIPATVGLAEPVCPGIVHKNTIWPISKKPRRAAINAFGFGGINAHMVLSEYRKKETSSKPEAKKPEETDLAIVGLGMHIGGFRSVEEFLQGLTTGKTSFRVPEESRWRGFSVGDEYMEVLGLTEMPPGAYINSFEFDSMRFKMPVVGSPFFLRRDMLLLETAAEAIDDAGLKRGQNPRTAVLVHTATDFSDHLFNSVAEFEDRLLTSMIKSCPELTKAQREEIIKILREEDETRENPDSVPGLITSVRGCRISAHWGFTGPSFSVFDQEVSIFRCLELARFFLSENIVDQVVIAVASLTGELPHIYAQKVLGQMEMMSERGIGEGIVALVVKRRETALADGNRVYALVSGIGISNNSDDLQVSAKDALEKTIRQAGLGEKELCALEVPYSYEQADRKLPSNRTLIEELCCHAAGACLDPEQFRVQEIEKHLGFGFSLSAAASVVRQALQLYLGEVLDGGGESATPWENKDGKQVALVTGYSRQNTFGCVALKEMTPRDQIEKNLVTRLIPFPIRFVTQVDLLEGLGNMKGNLQKINFSNFYDLIWTDFASTSALAAGGKERVAVLMGYSRNILLTEIDQLTEYLQSLPDHDHEIAYESSRGSYCATGHYGFQLAAAPAEGASANEIARKFGEEFGLSTELIRLLGLSETVMFYRPAGVLLSLGAKLLSHRIDFQWEKFFSNFHYQVLEQPSNIVEICNGIPKLLDWFASPEHKQRLAEKGAVPVPQQPAPPAKPTVAVKPSVAARSAVTTKPTMVAKPQVRQMKKSGPVPAKAPVASAVIDSAVVSSIKGSYQAYQFMADLEVQTLQTVMEISESLASGSYSNVSLSSSNRNLSKGSLSDASLPGKGNGAIPIQKQVIWDYPQILEMSSGKIENVLGEQYRASDAKAIRLGLPLPPLMLVSRITGLEAEFGRLEPCRIQGEYDVNDDCLLMLSKNTTALALTTEAAQIATVLLMYLGVDQLYEQEMSVRLLNSKTWYHHDLPVRGDTLRFVCEIKQFIKQKKGLLIHSSYACFVKDKLVLSIDSTISVFPADEPDHREESPTQAVPTLIGLPQGVLPGFCLPQQQTLRYSMGEFYEGKCGFRVYPGRSFSEPERLNVPPSARMVDRIVSVEFNGGRYGLGMVVGEADLDDSHWAFGVNLPNNPVFPGCLQTMAANQLQLYFAVCAGHLGDGDYYLERLKDLPESTSFLGQIRPGRGVLRYELQVKSIRTLADKVVFVADCECFWQDQRVSQFADISLVILKSIL